MKSHAPPEEREAALLIVGPPPPKQVAAEILAADLLAGYRLIRRRAISLRDVYWDLPSRSLGARRVALRLRQADQLTSITLKGPALSVGEAGVRRLEIEEPWSEGAVLRIIDILEGEGLVLRRPTIRFDDPFTAMRQLGLTVVQDRQTLRERRDVVPAHQPAPQPVAELVVDATEFQVRDGTVDLWQVEIESKGPEGDSAIDAIVAALLERYPAALRRWNYGKLATGMALAALAERGALRGVLAEDDTLAPAAHPIIANYLEREMASAR